MQKGIKGRFMAGIVPLAGHDSTLGSVIPDYLQLIAENYTAIERSVYECSFAGCDSIWIVCNDDVAPVVREVIGDYVMNPKILKIWNNIKNQEDHKEYIPIFYVPILRKDRNRRDSLGWSILEGALTSYKVSKSISKWSKPSKYYVSFPFSIYNPEVVFSHRADIRGQGTFYLSHHGSTVRENKYLGFTFTPEEWKLFRDNIRDKCTRSDSNLSLKLRWSSRDFTLDKIFNHDKIIIQNKIEIDSYHEISPWTSLIEYYSSNVQIKKPHKDIIKPYRKTRKHGKQEN